VPNTHHSGIDRRQFLQVTGAGLAASALGCSDTTPAGDAAKPQPAAAASAPAKPPRMPVCFVSHGSPMNTVANNDFTRFLDGWAADLPTPNAICMVSAHYEFTYPLVTTGQAPETVHDFGGFPNELYQLEYPAPGDPKLAGEILLRLAEFGIETEGDAEQGFDHGAWAPLLRVWPTAEIPMVQVSLYIDESPMKHVRLGKALAPLRDQGVLIIGSGNWTHNGFAEDNRLPPGDRPKWATDFDEWAVDRLEHWDLQALADYETATANGLKAHPTHDHWSPLLVAAGACGDSKPQITHAYDGWLGRSISMRCLTLQ
jgi:4,5-DOPA dioxygenase extradiol